MWQNFGRAGVALVMTAALWACGGSEDGASDDTGDGSTSPSASETSNGGQTTTSGGSSGGESNAVTGPTYHEDVRPLMDTHCASCHREGGVGPFELGYNPEEWASGRAWWVTAAVAAVESGDMPPWSAEEGCRDVIGSRALSSEARATFLAWRDAGFPQGDPAGYVAPEGGGAPELRAPDLMMDAGEGFVPDTAEPDDFQCLVMDAALTEQTFVQGIHVVPDEEAIVHHALVYAVAPQESDALDALDAADPDPGYTCFGGPGTASRELLMVWIPGTAPIMFDDGTAFSLAAGTRLVIQIHYNTLFVPPGEEPPADQTQLALWTLPDGEVPDRQVVLALGAHTGIVIEPDDPQSEHSRDFLLGRNATLIGAVPHMHLIGTSIQASVTHRDGSESCLVDVGRWDYNWQQTYLFEPEDRVEIKAGDRHVVHCTYDNTAANQPVINGQQVEPRRVTWGDGTLDEMCLNFLLATVPYDGAPDDDPVQTGGCGEFTLCVEGCQDDACLTQCFLAGGASCTACNLQAFRGCGQRYCPEELGEVLSCLGTCEEGALNCLSGDCAPQMSELYACSGPHVAEGECNEEFSACGVEF